MILFKMELTLKTNMIKRYNICTSRTYNSNGEEKKSWTTIGSLIQFPATNDKPEGFKIELAMFPTTTFNVFAQKSSTGHDEPQNVIDSDTGNKISPKRQTSGKDSQPKVVDAIEYPTEEINPDDIPF